MGTPAWNPHRQRGPRLRAHGAAATSGLFGFVDDTTFSFWQGINRDILVDLVASRSNVATLDAAAREAKLAEVAEFYDDFGADTTACNFPT